MEEDFIDHDFFDDSPSHDKDTPSTSKTFVQDLVSTNVTKNNKHLFHTLTSSSSESESGTESTSGLHGTNEITHGRSSSSRQTSDEETQHDTSHVTGKSTSHGNFYSEKEKHHGMSTKSEGAFLHKLSKANRKRSVASDHKHQRRNTNPEDSDSVTDVSPLSSPAESPTPRRRVSKHKGVDAVEASELSPNPNYRHITKLNVVFKDSSQTCVGDEHTLSATQKKNVLPSSAVNGSHVSGIQKQRQCHDNHWSSSSDENEVVAPERKKRQRKDLKARHDMSVRSHRKRLLDSSAREAMEICQLLETVLELEKQKQTKIAEEPSRQEWLNWHAAGDSIQQRRNRKNMSFSNDQVRNIDHENRRLLREITKVNARRSRPSSASSVRSVSTVKSDISIESRNSTSSRRSRSSTGRRRQTDRPVKLYHSALNRVNYQRQIERENTQLLKRLQSAKPTLGMQRKNQLADYKQQAKYMGSSIDRNGMSVRRANELTRNAEVVKETLGMKRLQHARPAWQDSW